MKPRRLLALPAALLLMTLGLSLPASAATCVTSSLNGVCPASGYYDDPGITGTVHQPNNLASQTVGANGWGAGGTDYAQTLSANSTADWQVSVSVSSNPDGHILAFPNSGWKQDSAVDAYTSLPSAWNVTIPADPAVSTGWAAYDLWFNNWADEVMIQVDITAGPAYNCTAAVTATFGGMPWHMCSFGSERVWKPGTDDQHLVNQASGSMDVQPVLAWMEANGKLPAGSTWTAGSFGFEVAHTSAQDVYAVSGFTWHAAYSAPPPPPPTAPGGLSQTPHVIVNSSWGAVDGATTYEYQLRRAADGVVVTDVMVTGTHLNSLEVVKDTAYQWRVRAIGGPWSAWRSFTSP